MNKIHPSRWRIRHKNDEKYCQILILPLGKDTRGFEISTKFFGRVYEEWDGQSKTDMAGDFATALRELRSADVVLSGLPQVNTRMVERAHLWLEEYEGKLSQFRIEQDKSAPAKTLPTEPTILAGQTQLKPSRTADYSIMAHVVLVEYIKMAGPMGDPKQIAEKTKAVLDAFEEVNRAE